MTVSKDILEDPAAFQKFQQAQQELTGALSRLLLTVERYPEMKATQNFRDLQAQLEGTENRIFRGGGGRSGGGGASGSW